MKKKVLSPFDQPKVQKFNDIYNYYLGVPPVRTLSGLRPSVGLFAAPYGRPRFAGLRFAHCYHPSRF